MKLKDYKFIEEHYNRGMTHTFKDKDDIEITIGRHLGGIHWSFKNTNNDVLSVIFHTGSYGHEQGKFEIMSSWRNPVKGDSVKGWLTFGEVQKFINELKRRMK